MNILFVCTGNTCRSTMAEGIFKYLLKNKNIDNINVSSAGITAYDGEKANEKAIMVLKKNGIDITGHKARLLTSEIINESDLILTMTSNHKEIINDYVHKKTVSSPCPKVFTLREFANIVNEESADNNFDIEDPFGMDYNLYEKSMDEIMTEIEKIIKKISIVLMEEK